MSVIWYKVWFDLWQKKGRTLLAVLSISAGVFAVGTIFGMVDQLLSTMDARHVETNPSHINVVLGQRIDKDTAEALLRVPGVSGVEVLNIWSTRYKTAASDEWQSATIVMRDDFENQQFDHLTLTAGAWPTQQEIAVERLSSEAFGINMGDEILLELNSTDRRFVVGGMIRHPFVPPPEFGGDTYLMVSPEVMARMGPAQGEFNQLLIQVDPYSEAYARDRMAVIKEQLAKQGIPISVSIYQTPEAHWGRPFVLGITLVLQVLAIVSLMASVILVINTMTAVITQQTDQIGVLKAIGGTTGIITRVYLAGVFVYGLLAAVVALPGGMFAAYMASKFLLNIFNIDYDDFQFSNRAVLFQVLAAVVAPLLAALWPVLSGANISVREAIASYGLGGDFGYSWLDKWIERIGERWLSSPYAIALGNVFRRKGRLLLTQIVLVTAGTMFIMVLTLSNSLSNTLENELNRRGYDIRITFPRNARVEVVEGAAEQLALVEAVEGWYTITGTVLREGQRVQDTAGLGGELYGVPTGSQMYQPNIVRGRWLTAEDTGNVVVISQETAEFNNLVVGDVLTIDLGPIGQSNWTIIGTYQAITSEPIATDPIYAPAPAVVQVTKKTQQARQLLVRTADPTAETTLAVMTYLRNEFESQNIPVNMFTTRTIFQEREYAYNQFGILTQLLLFLAIVMGLVGGIGLMGALSISVVERTREIGVLRAIGADSPTIMGMFVMEGLLQGVLSWFVAVPLALAVARPLSATLGRVILDTALDFSFSYAAVGTWLAAILFIATAASLYPAYSATRISVRASLAYG